MPVMGLWMVRLMSDQQRWLLGDYPGTAVNWFQSISIEKRKLRLWFGQIFQSSGIGQRRE